MAAMAPSQVLRMDPPACVPAPPGLRPPPAGSAARRRADRRLRLHMARAVFIGRRVTEASPEWEQLNTNEEADETMEEHAYEQIHDGT